MIHIDYNSQPIQDALNELLSRMGDMTPVMEKVGAKLEARVRERFETETDPMGLSWHPWADSYDPAKGGNRPTNGQSTILDLYGHMLKDVHWQADATSVIVGFPQEYAAYHEYGTTKMPRRGMLFADPVARTLAPDDEESILDILNDYLSQAL